MKITHTTFGIASGIAALSVVAFVYVQNYTALLSDDFEQHDNVQQVDDKDRDDTTRDDDVSDSGSDTVDVRGGLTLDLSGKGLREVPSYVFQRPGIEKLDLSDNNLTGAIQAEIRFLSKLRVLDLSDNQLTGVPAEVGQLSKLEVLDLANNQLTGLPYELGNLQNLRQLDLRGNNYAVQDLDHIRANLPSSTIILTD